MTRIGLLFGPLAAVLFILGVAALAAMIPGYSHVHQTMSEIGEAGSPVQVSFTIMAVLVAFCILVFAIALRGTSVAAGHSPLAAYVTGCMVISLTGVGIFSFPHPLHNVFGISEIVGYQAPLAFALTWRRDPRAKTIVAFSWVMFVAVWIAIALNLSSLDPASSLWHAVHPVIGIAQRALFGAWFLWLAVTGLALFAKGPARA